MHSTLPKTLTLLAVLALTLASGCTNTAPDVAGDGNKLPGQEGTRSFYMGVVPTPKNWPSSSWEDVTAAYEEAGNLGEVAMVWVQPSGIGEYEKLKQNKVITALRVYGMKPVVTLSFATITEVPGEGLKYTITAPDGVNPDLWDPEFRRLWVHEARDIASDFSPEYFSLGNEVNDYFALNPEQLDDYITLVSEARSAIKEVSPGTKVMVVFSYTHLIDNGQWDMFGKFDGVVDLFGLTTYPWKHYANPSEIPDDYYSRISGHTSKPIAFTEIGWVSSGSEGSSEQEQAEFLSRFVELTEGMDVEMVNWLFLHEAGLEGITASVSDDATSTISLKRTDGSEKPVCAVWKDLLAMPYSG